MTQPRNHKQWLSTTDTGGMLEFLAKKASDRKLRLFSCACCRRAWGFARANRLKEILPLVEGFADGSVPERELDRANEIGCAVLESERLSLPQVCLGGELWRASKKPLDSAIWDLGDLAAAAFGHAAGIEKRFEKGKAAERAKQAPLVREIFGNPFRPVAFDRAWRTSTVVQLATGIYNSRDFGAMPILADALQDAGCTSDVLLAHLRDSNADHVRGCWALDLILGKS